MVDSAYRELIARRAEVALLESTASVLSWDQETQMPAAGVEHRARQLGQLARMAHELAVAAEVGDALSACEADAALLADAEGVAAVNVRELRRDYERAIRLPVELVTEWTETTSRAQHAWAAARQAADFAQFEPHLSKLVGLARQRAACLRGDAHAEPWDALADEYEPGMTAAGVHTLFASMRGPLVELVDTARGAPQPDDRLVRLRLPVAQQEAFVRHVVGCLGFDFDRGRLDRSTHPFSIPIGPGDVRITTRFADDNVLDALGSTMHEAGHGMYEQGLPAEHFGTPRGQAVSLGIHESQSRLWENQVGRSRAFWTWCHPLLERFFGAAVVPCGVDEVWRCANLVRAQPIRVEADEVTYNLHVMVRFELELALLRGDLEVADLSAAWNRGYADLLGLEVENDAQGCLQDVHWSCGMFGYFPTYSLGNIYAAQLYAAADRALGGLDEALARGEFGGLLGWLAEHVHARGQTDRPAQLCERATGAPPSTTALLDGLRDKVARVYG